MPTLKNAIEDLAEQLTSGILAAIRSASLEELLGEKGHTAKRGPGRPPKTNGVQTSSQGRGRGRPRKEALAATKTGNGGRLARRSPEDIERIIGAITKALAGASKGLRSEELQRALQLSKKEIVGPLNQALAAKKIGKKGQKRATTYTLK